MTELATREAGAVTIVDIPQFFMEMDRKSERRGTLEQLVSELLASGKRKILLKLSAVRYSSNTALGELIGAFKTIRDGGGRLKLCSEPASLRAQLELTRLQKVFEVYEDEASAMQAFEAE